MSAPANGPLAELRARMPDVAADLRLNLDAVLQAGGVLSPAQRWGTAIAAAHACGASELARALEAAARAEHGDALVDDARAAAVLMAMNNVYYRFRHRIGKPSYAEKPARLRMTRLAKPATNKVDFELFALAVSAINDCEACVRAHESAVLAGGATEDHVHEAIRIAATLAGSAAALALTEPTQQPA